MRSILAGLLLGTALLGATAASADTYFMVDPNPGGVGLDIDEANKDANHFTGTIGVGGPGITIDTIGNVNTGSGYANISPVKDGELTSLLFTPDDSDLLTGFSTRGQLEEAAGGTITITVQDNQGHAPEVFVFSGFGDDHDFDRIGIIAAVEGETIAWVKIESNFREFKQTDFSFATAVPEPAAWSLMILGFAGLGFATRARRNARA